MNGREKLSCCVVAGALAVAVGACGSSANSSAPDTSTAASTVAAVPAVKIAVKPKTIGVVEAVGSAEIEAKSDRLMLEAGKALGWNVKLIDAGGNPQKMLQAAQSLVNQHVDALVTVTLEGAAIRGPLLQARKMGIPTISTAGGTTPSPQLFTAQYEENEYKMAQQLADWAKKNQASPKIANLQSTLASSAVDRDKAWHTVFPSSAFAAQQQVDPANAAASTQSIVNDMLTAHPDITLVHAVYDDMTRPATKTVTSRGSDAKVVGYFVDSVKAPMLADPKSPLVALSDSNLAHTNAVAFDQLVHHFQTGAPIDPNALKQDPLTYRVVTKDNIASNPPYEPEAILKPYLEKWAKEYPPAS